MADLKTETPPTTTQSGRVTLPPLTTVSPQTHNPHTPAKTPSRSNRGFSRKLQNMMNQHSVMVEGEQGRVGRRKEMVEQRNWKQLSDRQLSKLTPIERSRYMAYEPLPKAAQERQIEALKRVRAVRTLQKSQQLGPTLGELIETEYNSELVGQLKAAEARHRISLTRRRYEMYKAEELQHLIASQPSSIEAVRLRTFVPSHPYPLEAPDFLNKFERTRCETILEDEKGLTINRTA